MPPEINLAHVQSPPVDHAAVPMSIINRCAGVQNLPESVHLMR